MIWQVEFDDRARKELRKLDQGVQKQILRYLRERIAASNDPTRFGKALTANLSGLWRYRVGSYRLICRIERRAFVVAVIRVADRKEVYEPDPPD